MIDLKPFQEALGRALFFTQRSPERFQRFARAIRADPEAGPETTDREIHARLDSLIGAGQKLITFATEHKLFPVEAGFGRTDALDLIGNQVYGVKDDQNQAVANAPVNYPHLWDTSWFDWVQYNASIRTPMARNIGEALGVMALLKLGDPGPKQLLGTVATSVNVPNLARLENLLGGTDPLSAAPGPEHGLQPPRWNEVMADLTGVTPGSSGLLPDPVAIDPVLALEGRELYRKYCQHCHLHPRDELQAKLRDGTDFDAPWQNFTKPDRVSKKRFLKLRVVDLDVIGTDPNQALNFYRRVVVDKNYPLDPADPPPPGSRPLRVENATIPAATGLYRVTSLIRAREYAALNLYDEEGSKRIEFDRYRSVPETISTDDKASDLAAKLDTGDPATIKGGAAMGDVIQANLGYKARPLDGVWATPPFLHNGSVPTLDDLLRPVAERPAVFATGSTLYDPVKVGYDTAAFPGASRFDTSVSGNRNTGHEFRDLTLEEMENAAGLAPAPNQPEDRRMARALAIPFDDFARLDPGAVRAQIRRFTRAVNLLVPSPDSPLIKGRIGPALDDSERARLLAYLKSI